MARDKKKTRLHLKFSAFSVILTVISIAIIGATFYTTLNYWFQIYNKHKELAELDNKYKKLKKKGAALKVDVNKMQDSDYIARYAREKYLYSKDGEFILNIK